MADVNLLRYNINASLAEVGLQLVRPERAWLHLTGSRAQPPHPQFLCTAGSDIVRGGESIRLRGFGLGGWMSMENFITGFAGNEAAMRRAMLSVLGRDLYDAFFDRLLDVFFTDADAALLAATGVNTLRIAIHYRQFEDDERPFVVKNKGFRALDRVIDACAQHGIHSIIDLHALPGYQNQRWHSDNPATTAFFWDHPHFHDRVVNLWQALSDHYRDNSWVAGYNLVNEPGDPTREVVGPFTARLVDAVRQVDRDHILFLDGNTYSTEFDVFGGIEDDNLVYACHDYAAPGLGDGGPYPGETRGQWVDQPFLLSRFLSRSAYSRDTKTPVWVGEFGPVYTGDPERDVQRRRVLEDQLAIYRDRGAHWSLWTYKDMGMQGLVSVRPDSAYGQLVGGFMAKKKRLSVDSWGGNGIGPKEVTDPFHDLMGREFPSFDPYPWGAWDYTKTLLLNVTIAGAMVQEYAELFRGLGESDLIAVADSFALDQCAVRTSMRDLIVADGIASTSAGAPADADADAGEN